MTILVDSDILFEVMRAKDPGVLSKWSALSDSGDAVLYSPVSSAELWAGARPGEHIRLTALFATLVCAPIDDAVGRKAGEYLSKYRKSHSLELADALIAASAVSNGAALWTKNRKHYPMTGLSLF